MNLGRHAHGLVKLDSLVYVFGGYTPQGIDNSGERYNLKSGTWEKLPASLSEGISYVNCAIHKNAIYMSSIENLLVYKYDPKLE